MKYRIREVDAGDDEIADFIHEMNRDALPKFPELMKSDLDGDNCFWWLAYKNKMPVGFTGVVPSRLYPNAGYLKRSYVAPEHRGHGLQLRFFRARENKARKIGWNMLISECTGVLHSANNFIRAGFEMFEPEDPWAFKDSLYWRKIL